MYAKGREKGTVRFSLKPDGGAATVQLAGCFTGWQPVAMRKGKDGAFARAVTLPAGTYEYKFLVDRQWHCDPAHSDWAMNAFGTFNSVAQVP